jgi:hypothetical protein
MNKIKALLAIQLWKGSKFDIGHLMLAVTFLITYLPQFQTVLDGMGLTKYDTVIPEVVKILTSLRLLYKQWAPDSVAAASDAAKAPANTVALERATQVSSASDTKKS